jgi:hypothetical protein
MSIGFPFRHLTKEHRFQFWQVRATVTSTPAESDVHHHAHARLQATIVQWRRILHPAIDELLKDHERPDVAALWEPLSALDVSVGVEDLKPPERLLTAGRRLDNLTIICLDVPTPPPVIEEPWHPDDEPPLEEALAPKV